MPALDVSWKDPTTRADASDLAASEIAGIALSQRVKGEADFVPVAIVPAGDEHFTVTGLPGGATYEFELVVVDTQTPPKASSAVICEGTLPEVVPNLAAPSPVTDAQTAGLVIGGGPIVQPEPKGKKR